MGRISVSHDIDAPAERVWHVIEPIERHVEWMGDAGVVRFDGNQTRGVGTRIVCDLKLGPLTVFRDRMEVTEWEPARRMGIRHTGVVTGTGVFELLPIDLDRRTRFVWTEELDFPWYLGGPVGERLGGWVLRPIWRRNLRTLARIVESAPSGEDANH
jgi:carbon monoxide dehydrogenase subunit G